MSIKIKRTTEVVVKSRVLHFSNRPEYPAGNSCSAILWGTTAQEIYIGPKITFSGGSGDGHWKRVITMSPEKMKKLAKMMLEFVEVYEKEIK